MFPSNTFSPVSFATFEVVCTVHNPTYTLLYYTYFDTQTDSARAIT